MKLEEKLSELQKIAEQLDNAETSLDTSIELYKKSIELAKSCVDELNEAKGKIAVIKKEADNIIESDVPEDLK